MMQFSVITISYNSASTIERTFRSVLNQDFRDFEYIVVDGGSTDGTIDIIKRYEPLFEGRMRWSSEPDKGIYDAMNKGIGRSAGTIVGIVNSDDWLQPDALSAVYDKYVEVGRRDDCLYCGGIFYHKDDAVKIMPVNMKALQKNARFYMLSGIRHPATFVPKAVYDKMGVYDTAFPIAADSLFLLHCYYAGVEFVAMSNIISNMQAGGVSTTTSRKNFKISCRERKQALRTFGKSGLSLGFYYHLWKCRRILRYVAIRLHLHVA